MTADDKAFLRHLLEDRHERNALLVLHIYARGVENNFCIGDETSSGQEVLDRVDVEEERYKRLLEELA